MESDFRPARTTFVLGGAASGKSRFAESLVGRDRSTAYLATAFASDDEMRAKIEAHRARRPAEWRTIEVDHLNLVTQLRDLDAEVILLDSLTLYVAGARERLGAGADDHFDQLIEEIGRSEKSLIIVSDEVGAGLVPATSEGRAFRETLGRVNAAVAAVAQRVYFVAAGLPFALKGDDGMDASI